MKENDEYYENNDYPSPSKIFKNTSSNFNNSLKFSKKTEKDKEYIIVIRFTPKMNSYSFTIPDDWTLSKLSRFIFNIFKSEINSCETTFLYQGKILPHTSTLFKEQVTASFILQGT